MERRRLGEPSIGPPHTKHAASFNCRPISYVYRSSSTTAGTMMAYSHQRRCRKSIPDIMAFRFGLDQGEDVGGEVLRRCDVALRIVLRSTNRSTSSDRSKPRTALQTCHVSNTQMNVDVERCPECPCSVE